MNKIRNHIHQLFAGFVPLADYGGTRLESVFNVGTPTNLTELVNNGFQIAIVVGAALAVLQIVRGGFIYMFSAGGPQISQAKTLIKNAIYGLILLLATYIILNQINPDILNLDSFNPSPVPGGGAPTNTPSPGPTPVNQSNDPIFFNASP